MDLRNSVFATAAFFARYGGARIDKIRSPWRDLFVLQLYFQGIGKRYLSLCLAPGLFTTTITEERPGPGISPETKHWKTLRLYLKGARISGCLPSHTGRGLALQLSAPRAVSLTAVQGQLTLSSVQDEVVWSLSGKRPPATLQTTAEPDEAGTLLSSLDLEHALFDLERERVLTRLRQKRKRSARALKMAGQDLSRFSTSLDLQEKAELLKSQLHKLSKGMERALLDDYYHPGERVEIELDPLLSPQENMERLFRRAGKYRRGFKLAGEREGVLRSELAALEREIEAVSALPPDNPEALFQYLHTSDSRKRGARTTASKDPWSRFELDGCTVLLGRNGRGNEVVTFRLASGNDLWLHTRNYPGAHVVVRPAVKGGELPEALLLKAAQLALFYSAARDEGREEVVVIPVKHVRKIPGGKPGQVTYGSGRTLLVTLEPGFRPGDLFPENRDT